MTADRWRQVESLCHAALARPVGERAAFLAKACSDDESLRADVESLVARAESSPSFLEAPVIGRAMVSLAGRQLGAYRVEASIGAGGMGEVYRAKDTRLGRDVALKVLPAAWAADEQRRSRFEREARAVAALNHPNICTIHDVGHDQGIDYLVMELIDGETLAARLARGPLPLDEALARAIEVADALDKAHGQGIIHRDLKPGNIMLARAGSGSAHATHAKLLDFGLARIIPAGLANMASPTASSPMTEAGAMLGTLQYMAPEQIEGRAADARTDIFAFGALLYEMVTGRRAFDGATTASLMAAILREDPQALHPREIDRIVKRCLAKDPLRRYQSTRDLVNDLEEVTKDLGSGALATAVLLPVQTHRRSGALWVVPALGIAAILGYFAWAGPRERVTVPLQRFHLQPPAGVLIQPGPNPILAMSPDGRWVAFRGVSGEPGKTGLYLRSIGEIEATQVAPAGVAPFFSPDSRWLGFFAAGAMHKMPVGGGRPELICNLSTSVTSVRGTHWSDTGTIVVSIDRALWTVPSAGGKLSELTRPTPNERHYWPHVLPGGTAALFVVNFGYNDRFRQIAVVSMTTGEIHRFPALTGTAPRYVPDGHIVFSRYGALHAAPFDLSRLEVTGDAVRLLDGVDSFMLAGSTAADISASGSLVYISGPRNMLPEGELIWLDRKGQIIPFLSEPRLYVGAAIDLDAKQVAAAIANELGEADLWVHDLGRGAWHQLTHGMHTWSEIAWSPDGKWLYFTSFRSGEAEIYRIPSNGGEPTQLTFDPLVWEYPGSVSRDGNTLLFWQSATSHSDLMTLTLEPRGNPQHFTNSPASFESSPRISPNGLWVAYASSESGSAQVHVRPFVDPGKSYMVSTNEGNNAWWSRDGRELLYQRRTEIWSVPIEPGPAFRFGQARLLFRTSFGEASVGPVVFQGIGERFLGLRRNRPEYRIVYVPNWIDEMKQTLRNNR